MFHVPATVMGMIGSAFMVASFAPGAVGHAPNNDAQFSKPATLSQSVQAAGKADRVSSPVAASSLRAVSTVELIGVSRVKVVLKDEFGEVLFQSDPQTNTTYFSKDSNLPVLTLKEGSASSVTRQPVSPQSRDESITPKRRAHPHGCIAAVSPLAQAGKEAAPSLCVTSIKQGMSVQG